MTEKKRVRADKDKESDKRYNAKRISITAGYSPSDPEGKRYKAYLEQTGQSANAYIKGLIKADLDAKGIDYIDTDIE